MEVSFFAFMEGMPVFRDVVAFMREAIKSTISWVALAAHLMVPWSR